MDPSSTLFTFLLRTEPDVTSVHLIGSWDNFSTYHTMERDVRRGRDQWKGCYSFKDIACDNQAVGSYNNRSRGLTMGNTYYYFYEVNGATETYDPSVPSTTACPSLPGQPVNTMTVPIERTLRKRSASMNSMRQDSFKTMDPESKFATLRPTRRTPSDSRFLRLASPPARLRNKASSRSLSPAPGWKRFFSLKFSNSHSEPELPIPTTVPIDQYEVNHIYSRPAVREARSASPLSDGSRARDMSPESLRRFLMSEELPAQHESNVVERPSLVIPEDIAEENDDDDNFATSAHSEVQPYTTCLSPPPFKRAASDVTSFNPSSRASTLMSVRPSSQPLKKERRIDERGTSSSLPKLTTSYLQPRAPSSAPHSAQTTPHSPISTSDELLSTYDSNDEDDVMSRKGEDTLLWRPLPPLPGAIEGYSLPEQEDEKMVKPHSSLPLVTRGDSTLTGDPTSLLDTPLKSGLDDFATELGWVVDAISNKHN